VRARAPRNGGSFWGFLVMLVATLLFSAPASASGRAQDQKPRVILVWKVERELLTQLLQNELRAYGFVVESRPGAPLGGAELGGLVAGGSPVLQVGRGGTEVEIWTDDGRAEIASPSLAGELRVEGETEDAHRLVAIQTVELLRARIHQVSVARKKREAARQSHAPVESKVRSGDGRFGVFAGVGGLMGPGGVGPSVQARLGGLWSPVQQLRLGLGVSLPIHHPVIEGAEGEARVSFSYVGLQLAGFFLPEQSLIRPFVGGGLGALLTGIRATAALDSRAVVEKRWRVLARGELGLAVRCTRALHLELSGWGGLVPEHVTLRFDEREVARSGPLLVGVNAGFLLKF